MRNTHLGSQALSPTQVIKERGLGTSLMVQRLTLCPPSGRGGVWGHGTGLIPSLELRFRRPHGKAKKKRKKEMGPLGDALTPRFRGIHALDKVVIVIFCEVPQRLRAGLGNGTRPQGLMRSCTGSESEQVVRHSPSRLPQIPVASLC